LRRVWEEVRPLSVISCSLLVREEEKSGALRRGANRREEGFLSAQADTFIPQKARDGEEYAGANAEEKASACSVRNDGVVWPGNKEGTMFRLLPGIFDIVPLRNQEHSRSGCVTWTREG